jgi:hypothetical protein
MNLFEIKRYLFTGELRQSQGIESGKIYFQSL